MCDIYHRATFSSRMIQVSRRLTAEHFISIFRLTESIINSAEIGIRMITTLMIKRMPLCTTDKLSGSSIHFIIAFSQRESLH